MAFELSGERGKRQAKLRKNATVAGFEILGNPRPRILDFRRNLPEEDKIKRICV
jgi:hypothetical protein